MGSNRTSKAYPFEKEPNTINHYGEGVISELNHTETTYIVRGKIMNTETNTVFDVLKDFTDIAGAESYFNDIIKVFPLSEILIEKEVLTEIKIYV